MNDFAMERLVWIQGCHEYSEARVHVYDPVSRVYGNVLIQLLIRPRVGLCQMHTSVSFQFSEAKSSLQAF